MTTMVELHSDVQKIIPIALISKMVGKDRRDTRKLCAEGKIEDAIKVDGMWYALEANVQKYLAQQSQKRGKREVTTKAKVFHKKDIKTSMLPASRKKAIPFNLDLTKLTKNLYSEAELENLFELPSKFLKEYLDDNTLKSQKVGKYCIISKNDFLEFYETHKDKAEQLELEMTDIEENGRYRAFSRVPFFIYKCLVAEVNKRNAEWNGVGRKASISGVVEEILINYFGG